MSIIFDAIASSYLREDEHWGCDLDVLKSALDAAVKRNRRPRYVDLGCGPGLHLSFLGCLYPEAEVVGVDSSIKMLAQAEQKLSACGTKRVTLVHGDITTFDNGKRHDVVSCLNNTLNNLYVPGLSPVHCRKKIIRHVRNLLRTDGRLVLSVYNREKLDLANYGKRLLVLPESDVEHGDLFVEYCTGTSTEKYYSHWSTDAELIELLERSGFIVELLEKRMARIVVRAKTA